MRDENARVREKFELSLDGRQIASIVVGALVILGVVFVLGLNVGRQVATRQAAAARPGDLEALDRAPTAAVPPVDGASLTFHDRLVKQKPPSQPTVPAVAAAPSAAPAATATTSTPAATSTTPTATPTAITTSSPPAAVAAVPTSTSTQAATPPAKAQPAAAGAFTIQIGATQERAEADRIAARYRSLRPRVETADVQGKGRWYRVRVGSFDTREAAERYRRDVSRETGVAGYVTASR
jgi:cell division septation protein DedD